MAWNGIAWHGCRAGTWNDQRRPLSTRSRYIFLGLYRTIAGHPPFPGSIDPRMKFQPPRGRPPPGPRFREVWRFRFYHREDGWHGDRDGRIGGYDATTEGECATSPRPSSTLVGPASLCVDRCPNTHYTMSLERKYTTPNQTKIKWIKIVVF